MSKKLLFLVGLLCTMLWSGNAWGQSADISQSPVSNNTLTYTGTNGEPNITFSIADGLEDHKSGFAVWANNQGRDYTLSIDNGFVISSVDMTFRNDLQVFWAVAKMTIGTITNSNNNTSTTVSGKHTFTSELQTQTIKVKSDQSVSTSTAKAVVSKFSVNYRPINYKVVFHANYGTSTATSEQSFKYATAQNLASTLKRTGWKITGWAASANGTKIYDATQSVNNLTTTDGATINLYAIWEAKESITLDENVTSITATDYHQVTVTRKLNGNAYNAICLPFDFTNEGWDVYTLGDQTETASGISISFNKSDSKTVEAGKPYLVKPASTIESLTATDVDVVATGSSEGSLVSFIGNVTKSELHEGDIYVSTTDTENPFKVKTGNTSTLKAFRAILRKTDSSSNKAISFNFGDTITGIMTVNGDILANDAPIYNLKGQRVFDATQPGIYVQNGRKFIVK